MELPLLVAGSASLGVCYTFLSCVAVKHIFDKTQMKNETENAPLLKSQNSVKKSFRIRSRTESKPKSKPHSIPHSKSYPNIVYLPIEDDNNGFTVFQPEHYEYENVDDLPKGK